MPPPWQGNDRIEGNACLSSCLYQGDWSTTISYSFQLLDDEFEDATGSRHEFSRTLDKMRHQARLDPFGDNPTTRTIGDNSRSWHGNMTLYMNQLLLMQKNITHSALFLLNDVAYNDRKYLFSLATILCAVVLIFPITMKIIQLIALGMREQSNALLTQ